MFAALPLLAFAVAFSSQNLKVSDSVPKRIPNPVQPFPLREVKLLGGPWLHAQQKEEEYLLSLEPERFLHNFRKNAGLPPKAPLYGGWESSGLAGHSLGHYLTACSQAYASGHAPRFTAKIDQIVNGLAECQAHRPDGMISAIPNGDRPWEEIRRGEIKSGGFDLNGMWSPWYTHHKVLMGLIDAYTLTGNQKALTVAIKFADWMIDVTKGLSGEQWQKMLRCEYGGMNDALAELSQITGNRKFLELAHHFYDHAVLDSIVSHEDKLAGIHSNTQIPKILGLARLSETVGGGDYKSAARFFYDSVTRHHTYVIGGNGNHEYFTAPDRLNDEITTNTCETCCTYNMLKLARDLFQWSPDPKYLDYYERAHLNDILASQDPDSGMVTYFFPLLSGARRQYSNPEDDFTCCHGTGMENHTKHQDSVYFHSGTESLYVAQFEPTELKWPETGLQLRQETDFPTSGKVTLNILEGTRQPLTLFIRHPGWAASYDVFLNGTKILRSQEPTSFVHVRRRFKKGDRIQFEMPMGYHSEPILGDSNKVALLYGPSVLAADLGTDDGSGLETPVLVPDGKPLSDCIAKTGPESFEIAEAARPRSLTMRPIYQIPENRYAVYFDVFTESHWRNAEASYRKEETRQKDLELRTVDVLRVGEMQPERDHHLTSEKCDQRDANGKGFRTPMANGFFEFELKVDPTTENQLVVTYWANDRFQREGTISVDGQEIAKQDSVNRLPTNHFQDVTYDLPKSLTEGKSVVKIRFSGSTMKSGGSVAQVRCVRPPKPE
jgi:DUF1680 family protein